MSGGVNATIERLPAFDGNELALHSWVGAAPEAVVVYVHGLQSHAGWLFETGPALAERGIALVVADRRGSGKSGGGRGDVVAHGDWLDDYAAVVAAARARHPGLPLTIFGQSFGASVVAGLLARDPTIADGVLFCTPALGQNRVKLSPKELDALRAGDLGSETIPVRLEDAWYTDDARYLAFMRDDPGMMRTMTQRFRGAMVRLEDSYMDRASGWLKLPTAFIGVPDDPIIRRDAARAAVRSFCAGSVVDIEVPFHLHYLEFSPWRRLFVEVVAALAKTNAPSK